MSCCRSRATVCCRVSCTCRATHAKFARPHPLNRPTLIFAIRHCPAKQGCHTRRHCATNSPRSGKAHSRSCSQMSSRVQVDFPHVETSAAPSRARAPVERPRRVATVCLGRLPMSAGPAWLCSTEKDTQRPRQNTTVQIGRWVGCSILRLVPVQGRLLARCSAASSLLQRRLRAPARLQVAEPRIVHNINAAFF